MREYHKIEGLYQREETTKKLLPGVFRNPLVEYLKDNQWDFTEKVDGTNIRVVWDGHKVSFYGRTSRAIIPSHLLARLEELFGGEANEQVFEQNFADKQVTLYGEGYGPKIQNGGLYRSTVDFILFDVEVNGVFLERADVEQIAHNFGIDVVPVIFQGTIQQAEDFVKTYPKSSLSEAAPMEGLVGRPSKELYSRFGNRIIIKVKARDYREIESYTQE